MHGPMNATIHYDARTYERHTPIATHKTCSSERALQRIEITKQNAAAETTELTNITLT
jgi:hypothetical protein